MNGCTCEHPVCAAPVTPWAEQVSSAQMENIKKNFASVKPQNETPLAILAVAPPVSVNASQTPKAVVAEALHVVPFYTGYARIDNPITDALRGKSKELKLDVYDIICNDFLPNNVHGLEEQDRLALIGLGVEKAQYLADHFLDEKTKASFMEAMRSIARIGTQGKRVGCDMEYNVKHIILFYGYDHVRDDIRDETLFSMKKESPEAYATYKKLEKPWGSDNTKASSFLFQWRWDNYSLILKNMEAYNKHQKEQYKKLQEVKLDTTFAGADTSDKKSFLASVTEKLMANQNLQTDFFMERIKKMADVPDEFFFGKWLIGPKWA